MYCIVVMSLLALFFFTNKINKINYSGSIKANLNGRFLSLSLSLSFFLPNQCRKSARYEKQLGKTQVCLICCDVLNNTEMQESFKAHHRKKFCITFLYSNSSFRLYKEETHWRTTIDCEVFSVSEDDF